MHIFFHQKPRVEIKPIIFSAVLVSPDTRIIPTVLFPQEGKVNNSIHASCNQFVNDIHHAFVDGKHVGIKPVFARVKVDQFGHFHVIWIRQLVNQQRDDPAAFAGQAFVRTYWDDNSQRRKRARDLICERTGDIRLYKANPCVYLR